MTQWICDSEEKIRFCLAIDAVLDERESPLQKIKVVNSTLFGKVLLLDEVIMITERDEFVYREMMAHVPTCLHKNPRSVLVIGGGDCGILTELTKYDCLEKITMCEIDEEVVNVCRKHFPNLTVGLSDPRVELVFADGIDYVRDLPAKSYDVVIVDSTDSYAPSSSAGPGVVLFHKEFYQGVSNVLASGGIMAAQTQSAWSYTHILNRIRENITSTFPHTKVYTASIPTYLLSLWTWTLASNSEIKPSEAVPERLDKFNASLRYLTPQLMTSCFHLPKFMHEQANDI